MDLKSPVSDRVGSGELVGIATQPSDYYPRSNSPRPIEVTLRVMEEPKLAPDDLYLTRIIHPVCGEKMPEPEGVDCLVVCGKS